MTLLRPYHPSDAQALAAIYREAARTIGSDAYGPEQVAMWASYPEDMDEFRFQLSLGATFVAEISGKAVAFGQLHPWDHVALLYCGSQYARKGVGSQIYRELEAQALASGVKEIHTEATRMSRPFFEKQGYVVCLIESPVRQGIAFERFRMVKRMNA